MNITREQFEKLAKKHLAALQGYDVDETIEIFGVGKLYDEIVELEQQIMKTVTIKGIMADFLDSIRAYEHESGKAILYDERESSEFVDMYFNGGGKIKIEEKKPLFITEDGVSIYTNNIELFAVNDMFETASSTRFDFDVSRKEGWKLFYHESNADEYIWRNKRVFSLQDIDSTIELYSEEFNKLKQLAKGRIDNGK